MVFINKPLYRYIKNIYNNLKSFNLSFKVLEG